MNKVLQDLEANNVAIQRFRKLGDFSGFPDYES